MNTILFWAAIVIAGLILLSFIPGLKHFTKPVIESVWQLLQASGISVGAWFVFLTKIIWRAHVDILRNLVLPVKELDPTREVRESRE